MKFNVEYIFKADLQRTLKICVYDVIGNVDYFKESYENVADVELLELKKHDDGKIDVKYEFCAHGHIPRAAQHVIKPEMLTWHEISTWDPAKNTYTFKIRTMHFTRVVKIQGQWIYKEKTKGKTSQICKGTLRIGIPIVGKIVEKAVWSNLKKAWDQNYRDLQKQHGI